jgi:hypothetical protein
MRGSRATQASRPHVGDDRGRPRAGLSRPWCALPTRQALLDYASRGHGGLVAASLEVRERWRRRRVAAQPLAARARAVSTARLGLARSGGQPGLRTKRRDARLWREPGSDMQPQDTSIALPAASVVDALGFVPTCDAFGNSLDGGRTARGEALHSLLAGSRAVVLPDGGGRRCDPGGPRCFMASRLPIRSLRACDAAKAQARLRLRSSRARFRLLRRCLRRPSQSRRGW